MLEVEMKPIYEMKLVQIEITNACHLHCANCTRFVGHHRKSFFMDLDTVVKAIESLEGYRGHIGLMGGEPTLHPQFVDICKIYQEMIPDNHEQYDFISPGNAVRLEKIRSPKYMKGKVKVQDMKKLATYLGYTDAIPGPHSASFISYPHWTPWNYRSKVWQEPGEGNLSAKEIRDLQLGKGCT